jgi:hypothetical protein
VSFAAWTMTQDDGAYERISRGFREYTEGDKGPAFAVLAILALVLAGLIVYGLLRRDREGSRQLFRRLAAANGLTAQERRLLQAVAVRAGEDNLPSLFFRRRLFDETTADMTADPELLESVRKKVYDP